MRCCDYSLHTTGDDAVLEAKGRHDPCVVPRAVPIVEAMCALVLADCALAQASRTAAAAPYALIPRLGALDVGAAAEAAGKAAAASNDAASK